MSICGVAPRVKFTYEDCPFKRRTRRVCGNTVSYGKRFQDGIDILIAWSDALKFLREIPDDKASLVVTSPPYNMGKPYEQSRSFLGYMRWQRAIIVECVRILKPNGSICWEVGNYLKNKELYPLDIFFYDIFKEFGLKLRNRIVWHYGHGLHASRRFSGRYEVILWFTKGDRYVFNLDPIRVRQKYPGKRAYKGRKNGQPTSNPLGMNPSDFWRVIRNDWGKGVWDIPNVKANHPEKTSHPSQFPIELAERIVLALTNKGDLVLDPFVGAGTSIVAAALHDRKAIGIDKERSYTDLAYYRVASALNGNLKKRLLGKPIMQPKGTEKVARIPPEWKNQETKVRETSLFA